ncbi:AP2 domain transcription factor AP2IX-7 [Toxoplasma gondii VEG]|uniref:AP2 domain transcription factor AP2IX-7 n=2 Tax=Toxoplasma gondii TaxID=5811 RepID=V4ZFD5_TOXGV|nr:AP2 domain transcription factor AP2IX-7 [Toxoplasma gondii VEG]KFG27844.1 AP2 domain transcription factor AP2IX-7 [Toxoplasma gondii p89]CEL76019.1 TPA: AP2 domain transcription factor AP2IX-7 [Toxoplasma gondii VEG]
MDGSGESSGHLFKPGHGEARVSVHRGSLTDSGSLPAASHSHSQDSKLALPCAGSMLPASSGRFSCDSALFGGPVDSACSSDWTPVVSPSHDLSADGTDSSSVSGSRGSSLPFGSPTSALLRPSSEASANFPRLHKSVHALDDKMRGLDAQLYVRPHQTLPLQPRLRETDLCRNGEDGRPGKFDSPHLGSSAGPYGHSFLANPQLTPFVPQHLSSSPPQPVLSPPGEEGRNSAAFGKTVSRLDTGGGERQDSSEDQVGGTGRQSDQATKANSGSTPAGCAQTAGLLTDVQSSGTNVEHGREHFSTPQNPADGSARTCGFRETRVSPSNSSLPRTACRSRLDAFLPQKSVSPDHEHVRGTGGARAFVGGDSPFPEKPDALPATVTAEIATEAPPASRDPPVEEFPGAHELESLPPPHSGRPPIGEKDGEAASPGVSRLPSQERVHTLLYPNEKDASSLSRCCPSSMQPPPAGPRQEEARSFSVSAASAPGAPPGIVYQASACASPATVASFATPLTTPVGASAQSEPAALHAHSRSRTGAHPEALPPGVPGVTSQLGRGARGDRETLAGGARPGQDGVCERRGDVARGRLGGVSVAGDEAAEGTSHKAALEGAYVQDGCSPQPSNPHAPSGISAPTNGSSEFASSAIPASTCHDAFVRSPVSGSDCMSVANPGGPPGALGGLFPSPRGPSGPRPTPHPAQMAFAFVGQQPVFPGFDASQPAGSTFQYPPIRGAVSGVSPQPPMHPSSFAQPVWSPTSVPSSSVSSSVSSSGVSSSAPPPLAVGFQNPCPWRPTAPRDRSEGGAGSPGVSCGSAPPAPTHPTGKGGAAGRAGKQLGQATRFLSSVSGVVYDKGGEKWIARWSENGKPFKKTFAVGKHGFDAARKMAEDCRLQALYAKRWNSASGLPASFSKSNSLGRSTPGDRGKTEPTNSAKCKRDTSGESGCTDTGLRSLNMGGAGDLSSLGHPGTPPRDQEGAPASFLLEGTGVVRSSQVQTPFRLYDSVPSPLRSGDALGAQRGLVPQLLNNALVGVPFAPPPGASHSGCSAALPPGPGAPVQVSSPHTGFVAPADVEAPPRDGLEGLGGAAEVSPQIAVQDGGKKGEGLLGSASLSVRRRRKREPDEKFSPGESNAAVKKTPRPGSFHPHSCPGSEGFRSHDGPGDSTEARCAGLPAFQHATAPSSVCWPSTASLPSLDKAGQRAEHAGPSAFSSFSSVQQSPGSVETWRPEGDGGPASPARDAGRRGAESEERETSELAGPFAGVSASAGSASRKGQQKQLTRQIQRQQQLYRQQEALLQNQEELFSRLLRRRSRQERSDVRRRMQRDVSSLRRLPTMLLSPLRDALVASAARLPLATRGTKRESQKERRDCGAGIGGETASEKKEMAEPVRVHRRDRGGARDEEKPSTEGVRQADPKGRKAEGFPTWVIPPNEELKAAQVLRALRVQRRAAAREGKLLESLLVHRGEGEGTFSEETEGNTEIEDAGTESDATVTQETAEKVVENVQKMEELESEVEKENERRREAEDETPKQSSEEAPGVQQSPHKLSTNNENDASPQKLTKSVRFAESVAGSSSAVETACAADEEPLATETLEGRRVGGIPVPATSSPAPVFPCTAAQLGDLCMDTLYALGTVRPQWRRQDHRRAFGWHLSQIKPDLILPSLHASRVLRRLSPRPSNAVEFPREELAAASSAAGLVYGEGLSSHHTLRSYVDAFRPLFSSPSSPPLEFLHLSSGDLLMSLWQLEEGGRAAVIDNVLLALDALYERHTGRRLRGTAPPPFAVSSPSSAPSSLFALAHLQGGATSTTPLPATALPSPPFPRVSSAPDSPVFAPDASHGPSQRRQVSPHVTFETPPTHPRDRDSETSVERNASPETSPQAATLAAPAPCDGDREENFVLAYNPEAKALRQVNFLAVGVRVFLHLEVVEEMLHLQAKMQRTPGRDDRATASSGPSVDDGSGLMTSLPSTCSGVSGKKDPMHWSALFVTVPAPSVSTAASKPLFVVAEMVDRRLQVPCGEQLLFRPLPLSPAAPSALLAFAPARVCQLLRAGAMCLTRFTEKEGGKRPRGSAQRCSAASSFFYSPPPLDLSHLASFAPAASTLTPPSSPASSPSASASQTGPGRAKSRGTSPVGPESPEAASTTADGLAVPGSASAVSTPGVPAGASGASLGAPAPSPMASPGGSPGRPPKPVCCPAAPGIETAWRCKCSHRRHELQLEIKQKLRQDKKRCLALIREYPDLSLLVGAPPATPREKETGAKRQAPEGRRTATPSGSGTLTAKGGDLQGSTPSGAGLLSLARTSQLEMLAYLVEVDPWKYAKNRQDAPKPEEIPGLLAKYKAAVRTAEYGRMLQKWRAGQSREDEGRGGADGRKDGDGLLSPTASPPSRRKQGKDSSPNSASSQASGPAPSPSLSPGAGAAAVLETEKPEPQSPQESPCPLEPAAGQEPRATSSALPAGSPPWALPLVPPGGSPRASVSPSVLEELLRIQTAMSQLAIGTAICVRVKALLGLPAGAEQHIRGVVTRNALKFPWEKPAAPQVQAAGPSAGASRTSPSRRLSGGVVPGDEAGERREKGGARRGVSEGDIEKKEDEGTALCAGSRETEADGAGYLTLSLNNRKEEFILSFREVQCLVAQDDLRLVRTRARQWVSSFGPQPSADRKGEREEEKETGGRTRKFVVDEDF